MQFTFNRVMRSRSCLLVLTEVPAAAGGSRPADLASEPPALLATRLTRVLRLSPLKLNPLLNLKIDLFFCAAEIVAATAFRKDMSEVVTLVSRGHFYGSTLRCLTGNKRTAQPSTWSPVTCSKRGFLPVFGVYLVCTGV